MLLSNFIVTVYSTRLSLNLEAGENKVLPFCFGKQGFAVFTFTVAQPAINNLHAYLI